MKIYYKLFIFLFILMFSIPLALSRLQFPDYDSDWIPIDKGEFKTFNHSVGGDVDNYLLDVQTRNDSANGGTGINNLYVGLEYDQDGKQRGLYYLYFNTSSVMVYRGLDDFRNNEVRIRIWDYTIGDVLAEGTLEAPYLYPLIEENQKQLEKVDDLEDEIQEQKERTDDILLFGGGFIVLVGVLFGAKKLFFD